MAAAQVDVIPCHSCLNFIESHIVVSPESTVSGIYPPLLEAVKIACRRHHLRNRLQSM